MSLFRTTASLLLSGTVPASEALSQQYSHCQNTKAPISKSIQSKLPIGSADNTLEKEADGMADKVMRMEKPQSINFSSAKNTVNRKCTHCEEEEKQLQKKESSSDSISVAPPIVHDVINSPGGRSIDRDTRSFMESRFNYDFSNVKIHDSDIAAKSADSINALAYTSGNNIVFNSGKYDTGSESGKKLLAHELTHVIQQGNNINLKIQRFKQTEKRTEESKEVTVERIVQPGECKKVPETRKSSAGDITAEKSFFSYSNCRGGRLIETNGELNYGEFVDNAGIFMNRFINNPTGTPISSLLSQTIGSSTLKGNASFLLKINNFRMELKGEGGVSPSGDMSGTVSGLLRYADGKFNIELGGDTSAFKTALQTGRVSNVKFNTDMGPVEIRFNLTQGTQKAGAAQTDTLIVDGLVSYRPDTTAYGIGVNVQQVNGNTQVIFSFRVDLGGKMQKENPPECYTCICGDPKISFLCYEKEIKKPPTPLTPQMLPYYFAYSNTDSRPDWKVQNEETLAQVVDLVKKGYTISRIEGQCSPEGELERDKPSPSGFPGNQILSQQRADKSETDIKEHVRKEYGRLRYQIRQTEGKEVLDRLATALSVSFNPKGLGELFGKNDQGKEVVRKDLYKHLTTTLKPTAEEKDDPLRIANVIGSNLPSSVNDAAASDIEEFRTGMSGQKKLKKDQQLEELYKWLRRSMIYLEPRTEAPAKIDLTIKGDPNGNTVPCTDDHKLLFKGVEIPSKELFVNKCDK